jgi:hypothetical protein
VLTSGSLTEFHKIPVVLPFAPARTTAAKKLVKQMSNKPVDKSLFKKDFLIVE